MSLILHSFNHCKTIHTTNYIRFTCLLVCMETIVREEMVSVMIPSTLKEELDLFVFTAKQKAKRLDPTGPKITLKSTVIDAFIEYLAKHKEE